MSACESGTCRVALKYIYTSIETIQDNIFTQSWFLTDDPGLDRQDVRSGKCDVESLLSETQRKAIGNMAGQSTNNNVSVSGKCDTR